MSSPRIRIATGATVAFCGVAQFVRIARDVTRGKTRKYDQPIHELAAAARDSRLDLVSGTLTALSAPFALVPLSLTIALAVRKRGVAAWLPIALSPAAAMTAGGLFTRLLPQQFAPDDSGERSFPSGHATGMTAEVLTTAYVLSREKVIPTGLAFSLCGLPLVAGVNRVYRGRHWASDVLAGWAAGTTLAAACAIAYERLRSSSGCGNRPHTR